MFRNPAPEPQLKNFSPSYVKIFTVAACIYSLLVNTTPAYAWGNEGHTLVNHTAALHLPSSMPAFLKEAADRIAYLGPEPDRWRERSEFNLKNAQEPDHFIDIERVADIPELPEGRYEFIRMLYAKRVAAAKNGDDFLPEKVGMQPYITMEVFDRLKVAFRQYRQLKAEGKPTAGVESNIILYAGWLGHYVADIANPLHTTIQYNGWTGPNPNGYNTGHDIHWMFEGPFVGRNVAKLDPSNLLHDPVELKNPFRDYIDYTKDSNKYVERVYQLDKAKGFEGEGTPESIEFTRQRLAAGTQMLMNMWYTAWLESAQPLPSREATPKPQPGKNPGM